MHVANQSPVYDVEHLGHRMSGGHIPSPPKLAPNLASGSHRQSGVEARRHIVMSHLAEISKHLRTLRGLNCSPESLESTYDEYLLPSLAKMERAKNPNNTVTVLQNDFDDLTDIDPTKTRQVLLTIPALAHVVAGDLRMVDGRLSVILFDSLGVMSNSPYSNPFAVEDMMMPLPEDAKMSVVCLNLQKSSDGCKAFSLTMASKLAKSADYLDQLHQAHIRGGDDAFMIKAGTKRVSSTDGLNVYDRPGTVPALMLKHAQSRTSLAGISTAQQSQVINHKGQTLLQRQSEKLVNRATLDQDGIAIKNLCFSASIEDKRIDYIDRLTRYMQSAPAEDIDELAEAFDALIDERAMPSQAGLQLAERSTGPKELIQRQSGRYLDF